MLINTPVCVGGGGVAGAEGDGQMPSKLAWGKISYFCQKFYTKYVILGLKNCNTTGVFIRIDIW